MAMMTILLLYMITEIMIKYQEQDRQWEQSEIVMNMHITIMNNANTSENTQAAESRLRDTDMAEEMMEYSKNNILEQAGISMLMQANQNFRGILGSLQ